MPMAELAHGCKLPVATTSIGHTALVRAWAMPALLLAPTASAATDAVVMPMAVAAAPLLLGVAVGLLIYNLVVACFVRDTVYLWYSLLIFSSVMLYGWWVIEHALHANVFRDNTAIAVFAAVFLTVKQRFFECYLDCEHPVIDRASNVVYAIAVVMMVFIAVSPRADALPFLLVTCLAVLLIDLGAAGAYEILGAGGKRGETRVYLVSIGTFTTINCVAYLALPGFLILASLLGWLACLVMLTAGMGIKLQLGGTVERGWSKRYQDVRGQVEDLVRQNTRLQKESHTDGLTKIGNRAHFDLSYRVEWDRALRERLSLALLMVDIDHFKRVNDEFGHVVGDECLVAVALAIRGCLHRASDQVMRYGGEEFVVILGGSSGPGVELIGDRIRDAVKSIEFPQGYRVTVSVGGAAIVPRSDITNIEFLEMVDQALYRAKDEGRDRLVLARAIDSSWSSHPPGVLH